MKTDPDQFTEPASGECLDVAAAKLRDHGFAVEVLDDAEAARAHIKELIPEGSKVYTAASETLRLSGILDDINTSGRYDAVGPRAVTMDRTTEMAEIRRLLATPDVVVGSVAALTESGSLVAVSASGSQLPAYAGGAEHAIFVIGGQKVVANLDEAMRRIETHCLPLENRRSIDTYGHPSAVNRVLILSAAAFTGRVTVLLLREAIGF